MKVKSKGNLVINKLKAFFNSDEFKGAVRMNEQDFSRPRKFSLTDNILILLRSSKKGIQDTINRFIDNFKDSNMSYTKQAFSKGRKRINPEAILLLFRKTVEAFYSDNSVRKYKGYRVSAIDGTKYNLPNTDELLKKYGSQNNNGKTQVQALNSCVYDVLNGIIIDTIIAPFNADERKLAEEHLENLNKIRTEKELLLMDRGYPSRELLYQLEHYNFSYLIRVNKDNFLSEIKNVKSSDEVVTREYKGKLLKMRVVTIKLKNSTETLITNLPDKFTINDLKYLYHLRWGIETCYDDLKNKLEVENFTGMSDLAVLQDIYATLTLSNIVSSFEYDAQIYLDKQNKNKNLKYYYKINRAHAISEIKQEFINIFTIKSSKKLNKLYDKLLKRLLENTVAVRPDRLYPRAVKHGAIKYPMNIKSTD